MSDNEDHKGLDEIEQAFQMMSAHSDKAGVAFEQLKRDDAEWKARDPEGYKKDMEEMCKSMFGDDWEAEYTAMLREEFPEEFSSAE